MVCPLILLQLNSDVVVVRVEKELALINQIYTDVLCKEKSRELYNQLCKFRKVSSDCSNIIVAH